VFADFETAIHLVILSVWPSMTIWRDVDLIWAKADIGKMKIQSIGLSSEYKIDGDSSKYLRYFFGLPFFILTK